jgi:fumarate reductase subunit D
MLWLLFSAGGIASALLMPILVLLFGLAFPLGWVTPPSHAHLVAVLGHPLTRLALLVFCVLSLFHWAHRFRHTLNDAFDLRHLAKPIAAICYSSAIVGSFVAAYVVWQVP